MHSVVGTRVTMQLLPSLKRCFAAALACCWLAGWNGAVCGAADSPPPVEVKDATAATEAEMKPYTEVIVNGDVTFDMVPIRSGKFGRSISTSNGAI